MPPRPGKTISKTIGRPDKLSRAKAENAADRAQQQTKNEETWPIGISGMPMIKAEISASELIPTGQYANVSVGPARLQFCIDPGRILTADETFFSESERTIIVQALNEAAEIIENDVVAVQRNLVLESIQEDLSSQNSN